MKMIQVVAAIIQKDNKILATQRGYGEFEGGWEFPGGKVEPGERPEDALKREIREELAIEIEVGELLDTIEYDYSSFHLSMKCFMCKIKEGELVLKEHKAVQWLSGDMLTNVEWLPADQLLIGELLTLCK